MTIELAAIELLKLCQGKSQEEIENIKQKYQECFYFLVHTSVDFEDFLDKEESSDIIDNEELTA